MTPERQVDLAALAERVWSRRRAIAILVVTATVLVGIVAFLLPPWYRAQASVLPPSEEESGFGLASLLKGIGVPGMRVPTQATPADVFLAVLQSRRINEEVVKRYDLKKRYRSKLTEDAIKELRRHARFEVNEAGVIQISVEDRDPKRAADMANAYVDILDRFNRDVRMTKGRRTRLFVERRLADTRVELAAAEKTLADYQSKHKTMALSPAVSSNVETAARMFAQRSALQVRLGVIRSYTRESTDEEVQLRQQLSQIDRQLEALPESGVELARQLRDVKMLEQLFLLLSAQYEEARIDEVRDVPTVEVLDQATPPERKARPRRGQLMAGAFLLSLAAGVARALMRTSDAPAGAPAASGRG